MSLFVVFFRRAFKCASLKLGHFCAVEGWHVVFHVAELPSDSNLLKILDWHILVLLAHFQQERVYDLHEVLLLKNEDVRDALLH